MKRFLLLLLVPSIIYSSNVFDFLNIPSGARHSALGGGFSALYDTYSIFYNPAGIYDTTTTTISSTFRRYIAGINSGVLLLSKPKYGGTVGVGISYLNVGTIERRGIDGIRDGTFTPFSLSTRLAYSRDFGLFKGGVAINLIYETIEKYTAFAPAIDMGVIYRANPQLNLAISLNNIGYQIIPFRDTREPLPYKVRGGFTYSPLPLYIFGGDIEWQRNGGKNIILGAEIVLNPSLIFRAGYASRGQDLKVDVPMDITAGLSFGVGFVRGRLRLDYTVTPMVDLGITHQIGVSFVQPKVEVIEEVEIIIPEVEEEPPEVVEEPPGVVEEPPEVEKEIEERVKERYDIYVVRPGDWLSKLAEYPEVYGKGNYRRWVDIYRVNIEKVENPGLIYPGLRLKIPRP
ncbi:PorV/PorQ family protein [candidate division WOR-3 bacterium]|nr:PorV/PorQ family protein [candidate division WOR-3 bacterium]